MNSEVSYSKKLVEGIHSDPRYPSFGARIAEMSEPALARGDKDLPREAYFLTTYLIGAVRNLLESEHVQDREIRSYASERFFKDDMRLFKDDMQNKISTLPGNNIYQWIIEPRPDQHRDIAQLMFWNNDRRRELQSRLDKDTPSLHVGTFERVEYLVREGVYPSEAPQLYQDSINRHGAYRAMDSFESGLMGAGGWCDTETGKISLSNLYRDPLNLHDISRNFDGVTYHEETHSMGVGRGFFSGIATPHNPLRVWEEFWASHSQASTDYARLQKFIPSRDGRPYELNPNLRRDIMRYYRDEGRYVWNVHDQSGNGIPANLIGHAYASEFDPNNPSPERREMERNIVTVFGSLTKWLDTEDEYEARSTQRERKIHLNDTIDLLRGFPLWDAVRSLDFTEYDLVDEMPVNIVSEKVVD